MIRISMAIAITGLLSLLCVPTPIVFAQQGRQATVITSLDKTIETAGVWFGDMEGSLVEIKVFEGEIPISITQREIQSVTILGSMDGKEDNYTSKVKVVTISGSQYEGRSDQSFVYLTLPQNVSVKDAAAMFRRDGAYGSNFRPEFKDRWGKLHVVISLRQLKSISFKTK